MVVAVVAVAIKEAQLVHKACTIDPGLYHTPPWVVHAEAASARPALKMKYFVSIYMFKN